MHGVGDLVTPGFRGEPRVLGVAPATSRTPRTPRLLRALRVHRGVTQGSSGQLRVLRSTYAAVLACSGVTLEQLWSNFDCEFTGFWENDPQHASLGT